MTRNWYTVGELIGKLRDMPQNADVLLHCGIFDSEEAEEDDFGLPAGQTVGANCVFQYDEQHVYIVHSTKPDSVQDSKCQPE